MLKPGTYASDQATSALVSRMVDMMHARIHCIDVAISGRIDCKTARLIPARFDVILHVYELTVEVGFIGGSLEGR